MDNEFKYEFGEDADAVKACLDELSQNICAKEMRKEGDINSPESAKKLQKARDIIKDFMPVIDKNISNNSQLIDGCWEGLKRRFEFIDKMMEFYLADDTQKMDEVEKEIVKIGKSFDVDFKGEYDFQWFYQDTFPRILKEIKLETMKKLDE